MDKEQIKQALSKIKESSKKRNFSQSIDLIITLRDIDLKKNENQVETYVSLHHSKGKKIRVCGLVGGELFNQSKKFFDTTISLEDFPKYQNDKKLTKKLADDHDFFVAQATIMPKVAQAFGRILGTRGKMPNPKAGCVVPPNANLEVLSKRLHNLVKISVKTIPMIQVMVGKEDMPEEDIIDNIFTMYTSVAHALPKEENNVRRVLLKTTMGAPVEIGAKEEE